MIRILKNERGFTLVELMVVVVVLGVLAALVLPRLFGRTEQARVAAAQADISANLATALDLYEIDNGRYPNTGQGLNALLQKPSSEPIPNNWNGPYVKKLPKDPWGNPYVYAYPGVHNSWGYDLNSTGSNGVESDSDDIQNWE